MSMNPNLLNQLVKDHQQQLLREAAMERLISQARVERPTLSMRLRLQVNALLGRLGRSAQPRRASNQAPASASGM